MKKLISLLILVMVVSGCATPMKPNSVMSYGWGGYTYKTYEVKIISDPPGAKIEIDNGYVGTTPLVRVIDGPAGALAMTVIKAYPLKEGQYVQTKILYGNQIIPRTIYFNMNLKPMPIQYDINVR